ncbi:MAG: DUF2079 domain-containing protein, partial [Patescibacteria group bacterium]|nr:DUF2079 domain-containing protein [Patescibacteria group bacterium]
MFKKIISKNTNKLLLGIIILYTLFFSAISIWKYDNFLYNGLDLAIFNQVFFNTANGNLFGLTIHPHSYLGDHFAPIILLLAPIYSLFNSAKFLLALQSLILALSAFPFYLIAKNIFKNNRSLALILSIIFLLNPILWNINLFDFHILPFAVFFLLFAFYFYQQKKFIIFAISLLLALSVREDVSLVVFMFSILPIIDYLKKRKNASALPLLKEKYSKNPPLIRGIKRVIKSKWFLFPLIISIFWFFTAIKIGSYFNPDSSYKFLIYYQWIGASENLIELIFNILKHPIKIIIHLFTLGNLGMIFAFALPFAFLIFFSKKYLFLAIGPFIQIVLGAPGGGNFIFQSHYASLFLPALAISFLYGLRNFLKFRKIKINEYQNSNKLNNKNSLLKIIINDKIILLIFFTVAIIYANLSLGPAIGFNEIGKNNLKNKKNISQIMVDKISSNASVATTYNFLPNLSNRKKIYSMHYIFLGKKQFSEQDYTLPNDIDYYLINFSDIITYQLQMENSKLYGEQYKTGDNRLRKNLKKYGIVEIIDDTVLFKKNHQSDKNLIKIFNKNKFATDGKFILKQTNLDNKILFLGYQQNEQKAFNNFALTGDRQLGWHYSLFWQTIQNLDKNYQLQLEIIDNSDEIVWQKIYPLAY